MFKNKVCRAVIAGLFTLSLAGCSSSAAPEKAQAQYNGEEGKITVYLSGPEAMVNQLEEEFEKDRGDCVEIYHAGCGPLRQKIWTEVEANNLEADVFFGSNPIIYERLSDMGALDSYESEEAKNILPEYQVDHDDYCLVNSRYEIIAYDKNAVSGEDVPSEYVDLADPKFEGSVVYTDPSQSSTSLALTAGLWQISGNNNALFEKLGQNNPLIVPKSKAVPEKIEAGEMKAGITPHDAIARLSRRAKKQGFTFNVGMAWPKDGAIRIERPIAIMHNDARPEKNQKLCQEFIDFMLTDGQKITTKFAFYPTVEGYETPKGLPENPEAVVIDWKNIAGNETEIIQQFQAATVKE